MSIAVSQKLWFPFFTIQWKHDVAIFKADVQAARDGATINEHLRCLFAAARLPVNNAEEMKRTVHFSATFDTNTLVLWGHYYDPEDDVYHMKRIEEFCPSKEDDMEQYRRFLRNWQDYAMDTRLR
jgi:hypothetical protein